MTRLEARILAFLRQVESGAITLQLTESEWAWCSIHRYQASNGWILEVCSEGGQWAFIYRVDMAGVSVDSETILDEMPTLLHYQPSHETLCQRYHWERAAPEACCA